MKTTCIIVCVCFTICGCSKKEPSIESIRAENLKKAEKAKTDSENIELFEIAAKMSALALERARMSGKVEDAEGLKGEPKAAADMEAALIRKAVKKEDVREYAAAYVFNMRKLIELVREKNPALVPWADQMQPLLRNLEAAAM
jgi:hypothetical protein